MRNDDCDLVRLFGLSREEAAGLGLAGTADASAAASPDPAPAVDAAHAHVARGAVDAAHAHAARGEGPAIESEPIRMSPVPLGGASGDPPGRQISRDDEEAVMLALLDGGTGRASDYDGFGAARGLSLTNLPPTATPLHGIWTSDDEAPLAGGTAEADCVSGPPNPDQSSAEDEADDLVALFGLSDQEALGLGLANRVDDILPSPEQAGDGAAPAAPNTLGTMPLCAVSSDDAPDVEPSSPWDDDRVAGLDDRVAGLDDAPLAFAQPARTIAEADALSPLRWDGDGIGDAAGRPPTSAPTGGHGINPDLLDAYAEESAELLDGLLGELERLEGDVDDHGALLEIRRIVHTLKGGAKMCGFEAVVKLTHSCENLLDLCADGIVVPDRDTLRTLFESAPLLSAIVQDALAGRATDMAPVESLAARFDALCERATHGPVAVDDARETHTAIVAMDSVGPCDPIAQDGDKPASAPLPHGATDTRLLDDVAGTRLLDGTADTRLLPELPADDQIAGSAAALHPAERDGAGPQAFGIARAQADVAAGLSASPPVDGTVASQGIDGESDTEARSVPPWLQAPPAQIVQAPAPDGARPARRGTNSINVDLTKVDAVVAKITEMAAHRVSSQGMLGKLLDYAEDARRNMTRLRGLVMQLGNECAGMQPEDVAPDDDLNLEAYTALNTIVLQLQEAVLDQQGLVQTIHDTITSQWSLQAMESRADADIQSALMSIRLVPIANMRVRLDGVVRQAAEATGKRVRWQLQGGNVAVEKNVFDRLFEPLMHLLRNGVDHGIETAGARREAGKPETGAITVAAAQEGSQIVITVADDGAGIAPNRLAALAVERGLITATQATEMSYQQKMALIFTPGFSTADAVSHLSGRGVGMDTVREACLRIGGSIEVSSRPGLGTTFTLRLPLSMSVTRGLIIRDGGCVMALPVAQVIALHLVPATDIVQTEGGRIARIEGQELPVFNLPPLPGATVSGYIQNGEVNVLQVSHDSGSIGLVIEDVIGEEEILVKAAPALLQGVKPLLGAHVLPDGKVAPVINLPQLLIDVRPLATLHTPASETVAHELTALVVDDSMSMRVALTGTLQSAGFKVLTARDGQEALDVLKREGLPSLITLDVEMPRMDGLETLFAIRQISGAVDLPVFMMTSRGGSKHRRAAEQLGASRYFTKPYRDSDLANAAREACAQAFTA